MALTKRDNRKRIKLRIRKNIVGTPEKPRLSVFRSNKQIYAQMIDDLNGITLLAACSKDKELAEKSSGVPKREQAAMVGKILAERCKDKGIGQVVFDRNGYRYHGRIKSLAEAAREGGLKF